MRPFDLFFGPHVGRRGRWIIYSALISDGPKESITVRSLMKKGIGPLLPGDDPARVARCLASRQAARHRAVLRSLWSI